MSAGRSMRRGYVHVGAAPVKGEDRSTGEFAFMVVLATVIVASVAAMTDPWIRTALVRIFDVAWSAVLMAIAHL